MNATFTTSPGGSVTLPARKRFPISNVNAGRSFGSKLYSGIKDVGKAVGKAIAPALAAGALATGIGAEKLRAEAMPWGSYTDIVPATSPVNGNPISSIDYTSLSTISLPNNLSAVYFIVTAIGVTKQVGGFDIVNGQVTRSSFNGYGAYYGLWSGDTANSAEGSNPQNHYPGGFWAVFYDTNGDGNFGNADPIMPGVFLDGTEQLDPSQYTISNFSPYGSANPGNFTFTTDVPEPTSLALLGVGAAGLALRRRKQIGEYIRGKFKRGGNELDKTA